jgi:sugar porter (SP) family MFS transporter
MSEKAYLLRATIVAALGGLLFGFDTAVIAGTTAALTERFQLTPENLGFTVAAALWGTIVGAMFASIPGDRYGRKTALQWMAVLYFVSALGCALAWNWGSLLAFRFVAGLGIGGSSVLGPTYIAEIAPAARRGRLVGFFQFNIVAGILLAYFSNWLIATFHLPLDAEWRWMLGVSAAPALFFLIMLVGIPQSPRWLVQRGRVDEAREVLRQIGETDYEKELQDIIVSIDAEHGHAQESLFQSKYRFPIFLAVTIGLFNQLTGINAILYYLNDIFERAGFSKDSGGLQAVAIGFTNLIFTMLAMAVIDKIGRKTLLLIGSVGTAVCLAGVAWIYASGQNEHWLLWLLIGFMASFAFSQGAVIWVYLSEVFPNRVRAKGQSLGSFTHWFANALISWAFPAVAAYSRPAPFVFFCAMCVLQFFTVLLVYPETKGVTLEQMQKKFGID